MSNFAAKGVINFNVACPSLAGPGRRFAFPQVDWFRYLSNGMLLFYEVPEHPQLQAIATGNVVARYISGVGLVRCDVLEPTGAAPFFRLQMTYADGGVILVGMNETINANSVEAILWPGLCSCGSGPASDPVLTFPIGTNAQIGLGGGSSLFVTLPTQTVAGTWYVELQYEWSYTTVGRILPDTRIRVSGALSGTGIDPDVTGPATFTFDAWTEKQSVAATAISSGADTGLFNGNGHFTLFAPCLAGGTIVVTAGVGSNNYIDQGANLVGTGFRIGTNATLVDAPNPKLGGFATFVPSTNTVTTAALIPVTV